MGLLDVGLGRPKSQSVCGHSLFERNWPTLPDSRWLAYVSAESGSSEIYVQSFPAAGTKYFVSAGAGSQQPRWRRDSKELFYLNSTGGIFDIMSVAVESVETGLRFSPPQRLFQAFVTSQLGHLGSVFQWAVTSDGKRFLIVRQLEAKNASPAEIPLTVVLNWDAEQGR